MAQQGRFAAEIAELGKIDYFLDHLARAVERGEVHRGSYDLLAPRYLERRSELVAIITGVHRASSRQAAPQMVPTATPGRQAVPLLATSPGTVSTPGATRTNIADAARAIEPSPSRQVAWTTVLLFLGAFLVVVASAIFSVAVWDLLGATGKLAFLGTVTALFYGAGWWARTKLEIPAGGTTLTAVASAMLLLDGWIAIDGYGLEGPLPWAALLLVCSAVYWYTEVKLAGRFFGVVGAAAQLGWWWLLGEGVGLPAPTRLAGMALVALAWHLTAERAEDAPSLRSLSSVLRVAAPVTQVGLALGVIADLALVRSAGPMEVVAAGVVAIAGAWTFGRVAFMSQAASHWAGAALQLPFFISVAVAMSTTGHSWLLAGALLAAAVTYAVAALFVAGAPFAVVALAAELLLVLEIGLILGWELGVLAASAAVLAATWAMASKLARSLAEVDGPHVGAADMALIAEYGAFIVLAVSSLVVYAQVTGSPLAEWEITDLGTTLAVFASWSVAAFVIRNGAFLLPAAIVSWLPAAVVGVLWLGAGEPALRFGLLVVVAAIWLAASGVLGGVFGHEWREAVRWTARAGMLFAALAGAAWDVWLLGGESSVEAWGSWPAAGLVLGVAVIFAVESQLLRSAPSAAAAGGLLVLGGALAGGGVPARYPEQFALAGTATAAITSGSGALVRRLSGRFGGYLAVAAAVLGAGTSLAAGADASLFTAALAMSTAAWVLATFASGRLLAFVAALSGLLTILSAARWLQVTPVVTVIAVGAASLALVAYSLVRSPGSTERFPVLSTALGLAGLLGTGGLVLLGLFAEVFGGSGQWWDAGGHLFALSLALLAASTLVLAWRFRVRPGFYAGWGVLLLALWVEFGVLSLDSAEWFSTSLALYLIGMGYLAARLEPDRPHPTLLDAAAVVIGLGVPLRLSLIAFPPAESLVHAAWAIGLSLVAIASGVAAKVRWYFFGGVAALAGIALYRSFSALVEVWWLVLFVIGVALLVVALTWERQRVVVSSTRDRLKRSFEQWR